MTWYTVGALAILALAWLWSRSRSTAEASATQEAAPARREIEYRRPVLPSGVEDTIVKELRAGKDPDRAWCDAAKDEWRCFFQSVAGETFDNPNGTSRQSILKKAMPGQEVVLLPEPDNKYDSEAVAVYLLGSGGSTAQIGYLPRGHDLTGEIEDAKVAAWIKSVGAPRKGAPLGAVLFLAIKGE